MTSPPPLDPASERATDAELVRAAQLGEVEQLGLLLSRHQAPMRAVAVAFHGHRPAAEDAVQEAALIALRQIGALRDPAAVGPWLRMLVRNVCRMQLRRRPAIPVSDPGVFLPAAPDPAQLIDANANRDWIWTAIGHLTPTLQLPVMLRYFTEVTAYDDIATLCGVPVGTIRSRLNQARKKLAEALLATAVQPHDSIAALTAQHREEALAILEAPYTGQLAAVLANSWRPTVETFWSTGRHTIGYHDMVAAMDRDLTAGVRHQLTSVVASHTTVLWEANLINPPEDPHHCPPAVLWALHLTANRVTTLRLHHTPRPTSLPVHP
ncbi:sigma-70 family RNA polymerase sigma factor [Kribbella sandramycini]|uniref:RNA polymerase sigma-70 factor (ECF subfamily) n=1 Tax=Kribbella sandramycini TaxID=60450 RepID=A0A841SCW4_9ACTN|nr:RNA polymerase sigma-70 factor (ECF subfamily) [Kribbella sandramycini]